MGECEEELRRDGGVARGGGGDEGVHGGFLQRSWHDTQHEQGEAASRSKRQGRRVTTGIRRKSRM